MAARRFSATASTVVSNAAPMNSLRDVEVGVPFWPDQGDARLLTFVQKTKD